MIGITSIPKPLDTSFARLPHETLPELYADAVRRHDAVPVVLPAHGGCAGELVERLDGIVLSGGGDLHPARYGEEPTASEHIDEQRDGLELDLVREALRSGTALLGICRGAQVLNVALGGSLHQDIARDVPGAFQHRRHDAWDRPVHAVDLLPDSRLGRAIGRRVDANSIHHQAIAEPAPGLRVVGHCPDGVIEAVEYVGDPFVVGVQWHPECLPPEDDATQRLFARFVEACANRST
ncbi:MAG: gamma-glutamyl-gamma-aminobutyrate hydrolase family protein [Carbonactinosporaceae bacterium]